MARLIVDTDSLETLFEPDYSSLLVPCPVIALPSITENADLLSDIEFGSFGRALSKQHGELADDVVMIEKRTLSEWLGEFELNAPLAVELQEAAILSAKGQLTCAQVELADAERQQRDTQQAKVAYERALEGQTRAEDDMLGIARTLATVSREFLLETNKQLLPNTTIELDEFLKDDELSASAYVVRRPGSRLNDKEWEKLACLITHIVTAYGNYLGVEVVTQHRDGIAGLNGSLLVMIYSATSAAAYVAAQVGALLGRIIINNSTPIPAAASLLVSLAQDFAEGFLGPTAAWTTATSIAHDSSIKRRAALAQLRNDHPCADFSALVSAVPEAEPATADGSKPGKAVQAANNADTVRQRLHAMDETTTKPDVPNKPTLYDSTHQLGVRGWLGFGASPDAEEYDEWEIRYVGPRRQEPNPLPYEYHLVMPEFAANGSRHRVRAPRELPQQNYLRQQVPGMPTAAGIGADVLRLTEHAQRIRFNMFSITATIPAYFKSQAFLNFAKRPNAAITIRTHEWGVTQIGPMVEEANRTLKPVLSSSATSTPPLHHNSDQLICLEQARTDHSLAHWKGVLASSAKGSVLYHLFKSANESTGGWGLSETSNKVGARANFEDGRFGAFVVGTYAFEAAMQLYNKADRYLWETGFLQVPTASLVRSPKSKSLLWANALATAIYAEMREVVANDYTAPPANILQAFLHGPSPELRNLLETTPVSALTTDVVMLKPLPELQANGKYQVVIYYNRDIRKLIEAGKTDGLYFVFCASCCTFGCAKIKPADLTKERFGHKHWKDTFRLGCYQQISLTNGPHIIPYSARPDLDLMEQYVHLGMDVGADLGGIAIKGLAFHLYTTVKGEMGLRDLSVHFREYLRDFFEPNVAALGYTIEHPDKVLLDLVLSDGEHRSFSKLLQQRFGVPVYQGDREKRQFDGSTHRGVFSGNSDLELLAWLVKRYVAAKKWVGELQEATVMQWVTEKYLGSV